MTEHKECLLHRFDQDYLWNKQIHQYTCREVKAKINEWKEEFVKKNAVNLSKPDRYYQDYCKQLDEFLEQCPHK